MGTACKGAGGERVVSCELFIWFVCWKRRFN